MIIWKEIELYWVILIFIIRMIKSRRMRWAGHISLKKEKRTACRVLVGKPEGKRP
jgi:hypothetical protein